VGTLRGKESTHKRSRQIPRKGEAAEKKEKEEGNLTDKKTIPYQPRENSSYKGKTLNQQ